jgi:alpha-2-macroglobulin
MKCRDLAFALAYVLLAASLAHPQQPQAPAPQTARVESFSPQGTVKDIRQVKARFSEAMVAFGDPRVSTEPFVITCPAKGSSRWLDSRNWIFDFEADLPAGIACEFKIRDGLKTLSGRAVGGRSSFIFTTGGPAVISSAPYQGAEQIDEEQAFQLELNGAAIEETVLKNVYFSVEGVGERVGIKILAGKEREDLLKANFNYAREKLKEALEKKTQYPIIAARQRFPAGSKVNLVWGKGVASPGGVATEIDQVLPFRVRPVFTASFHCTRVNAESECVPVASFRVSFSASIPATTAQKVVLRGPGGTDYKPALADEDGEDGKYVFGVNFKGPFPEKSTFTVELPKDVRDDAGRRLANADRFPMKVKTDEYPPLAKFAAEFGIIELKADAMLPVTLRNIEPETSARMFEVPGGEAGIDPPKPLPEGRETAGNMPGQIVKIPMDKAGQWYSWLSKVRNRDYEDRDKSIFGSVTLPQARRISIPKLHGSKAFEVVGIPLKEPGFYVVEIESGILGASLLGVKRPMYVSTAALVTNLSAHFKWGNDASLVWVTTLDTARPVPDAAVQVRNCDGSLLWEGKTDPKGIARPLNLPPANASGSCPDIGSGLMITARSGNDMTFVSSSWDSGIEPWRFRLPADYEASNTVAHTVMDRTLLRAGETVHMKHIVRNHGTNGFFLPSPSDLGRTLVIRHIGTDQSYEQPLKWDAKGIAESAWVIPKDARLGQYEISFKSGKKEDSGVRTSGSFRVSEFRVPLMRGVIRPPSDTLVAPSSVPVDLSVNYLGGGGAGMLPIRFRYGIHPSFSNWPQDYEGFSFSGGWVKEGITRRGEDEEEEAPESQITRTDLTLDRNGSARTTISKLPKFDRPYEIQAELEFRDPNGEVQTVSSRIPLWPSKQQVGIKMDSWATSKDSIRFQAVVVDLKGKPLAGVPVRVDLFQKKYYSHRKRLVGGFYAYEQSTEIKKIKTQCEGKTNEKGLLLCEGTPPVSGNIILQAVTKDDAGRETSARHEAWIAGKDEWTFKADDADRIDLIPERKRYEPGEKAKIQVRMPFRQATALVTVEREGVGDAYVVELSGKEPIIEVPIKGVHAPNIFVSAFVVRGRVSDVQPTALVDLGRPAYKLGITELNVGWKAHELKLKVTTDRQVYRVREKARATISVTTPDGKPAPAGTEVAVAAVDEGLLELMPNQSWQLLEAMMERRSYGVQTSTAQMHVIGKRHYGLKALPAGGGGGRQTTRELFDTLLLWKGRVTLDARGTAIIEIPLNDSLTSFRIAAVANSGIERFGTASTSIRSTQDLILFSGIPPLVRQGDRFRPEFTLRNATEKPMEVRVTGKIREISEPLAPASVSIPAGESRVIGWDVTVPMGAEILHYELEASSREAAKDRLSVTQKALPAVPVRTYQATLEQLDKELKIDVERPADAIPSQGGIQVLFRPKLVEGLSGISDYMKIYPYSCLEQEVSKAVALRDTAMWARIMDRLPNYLDSDGLAKYWPLLTYGSDVLTSYVLSIANEAGWQVPEQARIRMLQALRGFVEGRIFRHSSLPTADLAIRKIAAVEALTRYGPGAGANPANNSGAAVRNDASLVTSIAIEPNLWPTSAVIDWQNILRRVPGIRGRDQRLAEAEQILRSRMNLQGTTMGFSTEKSDFLWWLMTSVDGNSVRMVLSQADSPAWKEDVPRMVRGALGRQHRGHWDTTVANAWGVLAMEKFSKVFENVPVTGTASAALSGKSQAVDWSATPKGKAVSFEWPSGRSTLAAANVGTGKPWATVQSLAAIPLKQPLSSGFKIKKTYTAVEQKSAGLWSKGDIVRVRLELESQADMTWVVVNDPIPAGGAIFGTGLGRDSQLSTSGEQRRGWVWPAFEERSFEAFRSYFEFVPKGSWTIEYTVRLNSTGTFLLPATRVEAMYSPEMFGELPNDPVRVQ